VAVDVNNPTGRAGLVAIDKRGCRAFFLDPTSFEPIDELPLPARPHEVAISADHCLAYVSIYGNGIYGNNTLPGREIVVLDLAARKPVATLDVSPYLAPHGMAIGRDGRLYASCDQSGVVAVIDVGGGEVVGAIDAGSHGPHMIAMLPDGSKLYSENEEDPFISVMEPGSRTRLRTVDMPGGSAGIIASADGQRVFVVAGQSPELAEFDTASDTLLQRVRLRGHSQPAQRVRTSPDGRFIVVTSTEEPLVTILDTDNLDSQTTLRVADAPMGVAFHPDNRTALVGNHGAGRITVLDLEARSIIRDFALGTGVETIAFY
jgi:DNA-binding beta-propeller fold protein YncE